MVRTKESTSGVKVGGKAPRKGLSGPTASTSSCSTTKKPRDEGGNPYCPRETPVWQKPITEFFKQSSKANGMEEDENNTAVVGTSSASENVGESSKENLRPQENQIDDTEVNETVKDKVSQSEDNNSVSTKGESANL